MWRSIVLNRELASLRIHKPPIEEMSPETKCTDIMPYWGNCRLYCGNKRKAFKDKFEDILFLSVEFLIQSLKFAFPYNFLLF